jgi:hypothetical protein
MKMTSDDMKHHSERIQRLSVELDTRVKLTEVHRLAALQSLQAPLGRFTVSCMGLRAALTVDAYIAQCLDAVTRIVGTLTKYEPQMTGVVVESTDLVTSATAAYAALGSLSVRNRQQRIDPRRVAVAADAALIETAFRNYHVALVHFYDAESLLRDFRRAMDAAVASKTATQWSAVAVAAGLTQDRDAWYATVLSCATREIAPEVTRAAIEDVSRASLPVVDKWNLFVVKLAPSRLRDAREEVIRYETGLRGVLYQTQLKGKASIELMKTWARSMVCRDAIRMEKRACDVPGDAKSSTLVSDHVDAICADQPLKELNAAAAVKCALIVYACTKPAAATVR